MVGRRWRLGVSLTHRTILATLLDILFRIIDPFSFKLLKFGVASRKLPNTCPGRVEVLFFLQFLNKLTKIVIKPPLPEVMRKSLRAYVNSKYICEIF